MSSNMQKNINVRVDEETLELLNEAAELDERTLSNWARMVLRREANKLVSEAS